VPAGNATSGASYPLASLRPVFTAKGTQTFPLPGNAPDTAGIPASGLPIHAGDHWTINMFVYLDNQPEELSLLGGFGNGADETGRQRYLIKFHDGIHFWGSNVDINAGKPFDLRRWQMITVTFDGSTIRLYRDGTELKSAPATLFDADPQVKIGTIGPWSNTGHFAGKISDFTIWNEALTPAFLHSLQATHQGEH